jgi:hypothetical protein
VNKNNENQVLRFEANVINLFNQHSVVRVKGGKEYTVTRTYKKNLKSLAHFWIGAGAFLVD